MCSYPEKKSLLTLKYTLFRQTYGNQPEQGWEKYGPPTPFVQPAECKIQTWCTYLLKSVGRRAQIFFEMVHGPKKLPTPELECKLSLLLMTHAIFIALQQVDKITNFLGIIQRLVTNATTSRTQ